MTTTADYNGSSSPSPQKSPPLSPMEDEIPEFDRTEEEYADEMQRELGDDAPWKRIQQNTFTRWANEHLKLINRPVTDLQFDLSDGLALIALIEVLSQRKLPRHNRRPSFRSQKLENVSVALDFLENVERIKLVNIDASHIVDGRLKLILGLIWTLILHYSIQLSTWEYIPVDDDIPGKDPTPKQKLMNWVKNMVPPNLPVNNFTTDWNDGKAIGALVDACAPGLYPDWETQDPRRPLQNAKSAMDLAEEWLSVPQLIKPEEMVDPNVDDRSMMTYLSQFPTAKLKPGAPLRPRSALAQSPIDAQQLSASQGPARCFGDGVDPDGNRVNEPANFHVDISKTGLGFPVTVKVINPHGHEEHCDIKRRSRDLFDCVYTPMMEGPHKIIVKHGQQEVPGSPFSTLVTGEADLFLSNGQQTGIIKTATGPGIGTTPLPVKKSTWFEVETNTGRLSPNEATVYDPSGQSLPLKALQVSAQKVRYEYTPKNAGIYTVEILRVPQSPYAVTAISDSFLAQQCRAYGRGIQPQGIRTGDVADFVVVTPQLTSGRSSAGSDPLKVSVKGPDLFEVPCRAQKSSQQSFECAFVPQKPGPHEVSILYDGHPIPQSPFKVTVAPFKESKIRAYGPGLEGGVVGQPADFMVETNDETGTLGFSIEGPSETRIECSDNGDGSAKVRYWPTAQGEYAVHICTNDEDIPSSPYMAWIDPAPQYGESFEPIKVRVYGPGVDSNQTQIVGKTSEFTVDTHLAGPGNLKVSCIDGEYQMVDVIVIDNKNGTYTCKYVPLAASSHSVTVSYGQIGVDGSPFKVQVRESCDPQRVKVYGPGLEDGVQVNKETFFVVDCRDAGPGDVAVAVTDPNHDDVPLNISDHLRPMGEVQADIKLEPGQYFVGFRPTSAGPHLASVVYAGEEVPQSPMPIYAQPDLSQIQTECQDNLSSSNRKEVLIHGIRSAGLEPSAISAKVSQPHGNDSPVSIDMVGPDTASISFNASGPGPYLVQPMAHNIPLCSPVIAQTESRKSSVQKIEAPRAYGTGLHEAIVNTTAKFTVDTRGSSPDGQLKVTIEGPSETPIEYVDNQDGTCLVTYRPSMPSLPQSPYYINITYNGVDIPGSPFCPTVKPIPALASAFGPGIDEHSGIRPGTPAHFSVDTSQCNFPSTKIHVEIVGLDESGREIVSIPSEVTNRSSSFVHDVKYRVPTHPSCSLVRVDIRLIDDNSCGVFGNPFNVPIMSSATQSKPSSARAYGDGLIRAETNKTTNFTVETIETGEGGLNMLIEGPSEAGLYCVEHVDDRCVMAYTPTKSGVYTLSIKFAGEHIPNSPFSIECVDPVDASKVKVKFPDEPMRVSVPQTIIVDGSDGAGPGTPVITVVDSRTRKKSLITSPLPLRPGFNHPTGYKAEFTPLSEGMHRFDVRWSSEEVPNSPFDCMVHKKYDPTKVKVSGPGVSSSGVLASIPTHFDVHTDAAGYPSDGIDVRIKGTGGTLIDTDVSRLGDYHTRINYTPDLPGRYNVYVNFNGNPIPQSPIAIRAESTGDPTKVKVINGLKHSVPINERSSILIDTRQAGNGRLWAEVKNVITSEPLRNVCIEDRANGIQDVTFTPMTPGRYSVRMRFGGRDVPIFDSELNSASLDYAFTVSSSIQDQQPLINSNDYLSQSASRQMSVSSGQYRPMDFRIPVGGRLSDLDARIITPSGQIVQPMIDDNHDETVCIKFQPNEIGPHQLDVSYLGQPIMGSPFRFYVDNLKTSTSRQQAYAYGPGLSGGASNEPCFFKIVTKDAGSGGLAVAVEGPSKAEINCKDNKDGTCDVTWWPTAPGEYIVSIKFAGQHISGSPFSTNIQNDSKQRSLLNVTSEHLKSSHRTLSSSSGSGLRVGDVARVPIISTQESHTSLSDIDSRQLAATVTSPSGRLEPCYLNVCPDDEPPNTITVTFSPREPGDYIVSVMRDNARHISGSPFRVKVWPQVIGNASKVRVYGPGIEQIQAKKINHFTIDTSAVHGRGGLNVSIEGPSKADIRCENIPNQNSCCRVTYQVPEPGQYTVSIKFADLDVPGSPFVLKASEAFLSDSMPRPMESTMYTVSSNNTLRKSINCESVAASKAEIGTRCNLTLRLNDIQSSSQLETSVTNPSGGIASCEVEKIKSDDLGSNLFKISFVPHEAGLHAISVKYKQEHISGSPFPFTVGGLSNEGGAHKVRALGQGLSHGEVNRKCEFSIYTREAGSGSINITIEGPSKADVFFKNRSEGVCDVTYTCAERGQYKISIKFNDHDIPDSPFIVNISESVFSPSGRNKLTVENLQTSTAYEVNKPLTFNVNFHGVLGHIDAYVVGPNGKEDVCLVQQSSSDNSRYSMKFIPRQNGLHKVHIRFNGQEVGDSPFSVFVGSGGSDSALEVGDAGRVVVSGMGLHAGQLGVPCEFLVNTRNAGTGTFAVTVDGPSKVQLGCNEVEEGYRVTFLPTSPGDYLITIKLAGVSIAGSPFKCHVTGTGIENGNITTQREHSNIVFETFDDHFSQTSIKTTSRANFYDAKTTDDKAGAKFVKSFGSALHSALPNQPSTFTVDATNAVSVSSTGDSMLMVGMHGTDSTTPCDEVLVKHMGNNVFNVSYTVKNSGRYILVVKWGDCHIPGSPFHVEVP
ncbi:hypothetical protein ACOME3_003343 [Neoechinorhynchus agilis]